jgi:hypothetical protein
MKKLYHNDEAVAYWLIAGYFAVVVAVAAIVS